MNMKRKTVTDLSNEIKSLYIKNLGYLPSGRYTFTHPIFNIVGENSWNTYNWFRHLLVLAPYDECDPFYTISCIDARRSGQHMTYQHLCENGLIETVKVGPRRKAYRLTITGMELVNLVNKYTGYIK